METIPNNKEECVKWLKEHNIGTTGTLQDLQMKIRRFKLYPSLTEKLRKRAESKLQFLNQPKSCRYNPDDCSLEQQRRVVSKSHCNNI